MLRDEHIMQEETHPQSIQKALLDKRTTWSHQASTEKRQCVSEHSLSIHTSSLSILPSSTLLSGVGRQYESSMWMASVIQSCSSLTPIENWLCSATILSSLDTFSWKRQRWVFQLSALQSVHSLQSLMLETNTSSETISHPRGFPHCMRSVTHLAKQGKSCSITRSKDMTIAIPCPEHSQ